MAAVAATVVEAPVVAEHRGFRQRWYRTPSFVAGASILGAIVVVAILAPVVTWHDPVQQDLVNQLQGPSWSHPLGTDDLGRDIWARLVYGARTDLRIAVLAVLFPFVLGTTAGLIVGYFGGRTDTVAN